MAPDTPPDAPADAVPTVATQVPLDLVIELVEGRLHRRRQAARRWFLGIVTASLGLALTALGLLYTMSSDYRSFRAGVELREALEKNKPHSPVDTAPQQDGSDESLFSDRDYLAFPSFEENESGTRSGRLEPRSEQTFNVSLERGRRSVFLARCDQNCLDLDLSLSDPGGDVVIEDSLPDSIPLLEYTPDESGQFVLEVKMFMCAVQDCGWELRRLDSPLSPDSPRESTTQD